VSQLNVAIPVEPRAKIFLCLRAPTYTRIYAGLASVLMSEQNEMDKTPGKISWKELMTRDAEASARFYRGLFGWVREEVDVGGSAYTFFKVGEEPVAGMAVLSAKSEGTPEGWTNYVTVENLEDSIAKTRELGGKVCKDITALPIGRFAIVQDPHGAVIGLWQFA
jgi:predicted enzyme related to lactoylglutathione lyase